MKQYHPVSGFPDPSSIPMPRTESERFRAEVFAIAADARASGNEDWERIYKREHLQPSNDEYRTMLDVSARTMATTAGFGVE